MSPNEEHQPTNPERQRGLVEVFFEIDQVERRCQLRAKLPDQTRALRESSVLHARALLAFFEKSERGAVGGGPRDEILAADFRFPAEPIGIDEGLRARLEQDLGRLAYSRGARLQSGRGWPVAALAAPVLARSRKFIDHLIDRVLPELAPEALPAWRKLRQKVVARLSSLRSVGRG
jgi:hypothetical protein